jgi:hypothetical protein
MNYYGLEVHVPGTCECMGCTIATCSRVCAVVLQPCTLRLLMLRKAMQGLVMTFRECPRPITHLPPRRAAQNFRNLICRLCANGFPKSSKSSTVSSAKYAARLRVTLQGYRTLTSQRGYPKLNFEDMDTHQLWPAGARTTCTVRRGL